MKLASYSSRGFDRGASRVKDTVWLIISGVIFESWLPGSGWRRWILRLFGAKIGKRVTIKPRVRVKFPWRLEVAEDVWIGESVWIDNLATISIGHDVCISQGAYLCTGSHDWSQKTFDLIVSPIVVSPHAWIGAMVRVAPGTRIGIGAVIGMGGLVSGIIKPHQVYAVNRENTLTIKPRAIQL